MNDTISRQQTITALRALSDEDGYINAPHEVVTDVVRGLPPVRAEQGQNTNAEQGKSDKLGVKAGKTYTDTISRKAAIDIIEDFPHGGVWNVESMEEMVYRIKQLPSAQTELEDKILAIGYTGKEGRIYIGGRLFAVRELAQ